MNNFTSIFEELSKLYEEDVRDNEQSEEVTEACTEELIEAAEEEFEIVDDETPVEDAPIEEPVEEIEPRQLVLECDKCGALVIKAEADVVADEESDLVDVEEECKFCEETKGYKIIGVVSPYEVANAPEESDENSSEEDFVEESIESPAEVAENSAEAEAVEA